VVKECEEGLEGVCKEGLGVRPIPKPPPYMQNPRALYRLAHRNVISEWPSLPMCDDPRVLMALAFHQPCASKLPVRCPRNGQMTTSDWSVGKHYA
jgi:hypothetical protein